MRCRFALLTDSHYHPSAPRDFAPPKMLTRAREVLEATVPAVNALAPDFVVHGGDLLCGGSSFDLPRADYDRSLAEVAAAYAGFAAPVHVVPGNHDCDAQEFAYDAFARAFATPAVLDVVDVAAGLRLALANVYRNGEAGGGTWTDDVDGALRRADAEAQGDGAVLFLVLHSWIYPGVGDDPERGVVAGAQRARATVADCAAVAAVFAGHRHMNRVRLVRDYLCIDTACLIGYPLGFREIAVSDDGWLECRWHTLDRPDLLAASRQRSGDDDNHRYAGELGDRDTTVLLPRARTLWSRSAG